MLRFFATLRMTIERGISGEAPEPSETTSPLKLEGQGELNPRYRDK